MEQPQQGFPHYTPFEYTSSPKTSYAGGMQVQNWEGAVGGKNGPDLGIWGTTGGTGGSGPVGYNMTASSYTPSSEIYQKGGGRFSGVEMDQLSSQMMALGVPVSTETSQNSSPLNQSNGYFKGQQDHTGQSMSDGSSSYTKLNSYGKWGSNATSASMNNMTNYYLNQQGHMKQNYPNQTHSHTQTNSIYRQHQNSASKTAQHNGYVSNNYVKMPHISSMDSKPQSSSTNQTSIGQSEAENFKMKLQLKDIIISKLELELEKEKEFQKALAGCEKNGTFEIPKNQEQLYTKLVETVKVTKKELEDTKTRLEALVTAIALNPNSNYKNGRYDEEEIAHKIITKMQILTEENEELSKMLSYGKSKEKDIEIGLLRKQNVDLREKISKLEAKLNEEKP